MPRRQAATDVVTLAFFGTGAMDIDQATKHIEDYLDANTKPEEPVRFIFPLTDNEFSDTMGELVSMAKDSDIAYEVITSTKDKARRAFNEIASGAAKTYHVEEVATQMEEILKSAPRSILLVLWDQERDDELQEIISGFIDAEIDVRDLIEGMTPIGFSGDNENGEAEADEGEEIEVFSRSDLEKMNRDELKEICTQLSIPLRRGNSAMIQDILDYQGEPGAAADEPAEAVAPVAVEVVTGTDNGVATEFLEGLREILDDFGSRFFGGLDEWLTKFSTAAEGFAFNTTPEEPMPVENEPPAGRRRLSRSRS